MANHPVISGFKYLGYFVIVLSIMSALPAITNFLLFDIQSLDPNNITALQLGLAFIAIYLLFKPLALALGGLSE